MTEELQALCFVAGANSIFAGEKLLTTPNPEVEEDSRLMEKLGMSFKKLEETLTFTNKGVLSVSQAISCSSELS
jgi:biotin synthase